MNLIKRIAWYSGGFIIGIVILMFFLGGKKASCDYGPTARTLKNIRTKDLVISEEARMELTKNQLDTSAIHTILRNGAVIFSESNTSLDSCKIYMIRGNIEKFDIRFHAENCSKDANITNLRITISN